MPKLWPAQQPAQKCLHKAYARMLQAFSRLAGGQDRLGGLEGRRKRLHGSAVQRVALGKREAGFR